MVRFLCFDPVLLLAVASMTETASFFHAESSIHSHLTQLRDYHLEQERVLPNQSQLLAGRLKEGELFDVMLLSCYNSTCLPLQVFLLRRKFHLERE